MWLKGKHVGRETGVPRLGLRGLLSDLLGLVVELSEPPSFSFHDGGGKFPFRLIATLNTDRTDALSSTIVREEWPHGSL